MPTLGARTALLIALTVLLGVPVRAPASDHAPPEVLLRAAGARQDPGVGTVNWASRHGRFCTIMHADGTWDFPEQLTIPVTTGKVRIILRKPHIPIFSEIKAWPVLGPDGRPVGPGSAVEHQMVPKGSGTRARWEAVFEPFPIGDMYVHATFMWDDRDNCGRQHGTWTFALRALDPPR